MFTFVSGNIALDFAGTVRSRRLAPEDLLTSPDDLAAWVVAAGVVDTAPSCDAVDLQHALALREAAYRLAFSASRGEPLDDADRQLLNDYARAESPVIALQSDGTVTRSGGIPAVLSVIARGAIELLGGPWRHRIKECSKPECTRLSVDTSRAGSRHWCDMSTCGNRAKSATFRARHQSEQ